MMSFIRVDDAIAYDPKLGTVPPERHLNALGMFVALIAYSFRTGTDGLVPASALKAVAPFADAGCVEGAVQDLVAAGVVERGDDGLRIVSYADWQITTKERERLSAWGRAGAEAKRLKVMASATCSSQGLKPPAEGGGLSHRLKGVAEGGGLSEKRREEKRREEINTLAASSDAASARFEAFWNAYPHRISRDGTRTKGSKQAARKKWDSLIRAGEDPDAIVEGLKRYRFPALSNGERVIPDASRWLNERRWLDAAEEPPAEKVAVFHPRTGEVIGWMEERR